jgi:hypothetical protein
MTLFAFLFSYTSRVILKTTITTDRILGLGLMMDRMTVVAITDMAVKGRPQERLRSRQDPQDGKVIFSIERLPTNPV